jgi:hypothetical protein
MTKHIAASFTPSFWPWARARRPWLPGSRPQPAPCQCRKSSRAKVRLSTKSGADARPHRPWLPSIPCSMLDALARNCSHLWGSALGVLPIAAAAHRGRRSRKPTSVRSGKRGQFARGESRLVHMQTSQEESKRVWAYIVVICASSRAVKPQAERLPGTAAVSITEPQVVQP